ncbi:MAG: hypothetical protein QGF59_00845 [Pirellulaceae bacterium]|nr:hypothetical protein [Pirellulaceae bacterium]|tara:strand:- start:5050 stop:5310 length:261 start_codon:yes stop_codon:yes gene_type:complete
MWANLERCIAAEFATPTPWELVERVVTRKQRPKMFDMRQWIAAKDSKAAAADLNMCFANGSTGQRCKRTSVVGGCYCGIHIMRRAS